MPGSLGYRNPAPDMVFWCAVLGQAAGSG